jgi:hypothetical protein
MRPTKHPRRDRQFMTPLCSKREQVPTNFHAHSTAIMFATALLVGLSVHAATAAYAFDPLQHLAGIRYVTCILKTHERHTLTLVVHLQSLFRVCLCTLTGFDTFANIVPTSFAGLQSQTLEPHKDV